MVFLNCSCFMLCCIELQQAHKDEVTAHIDSVSLCRLEEENAALLKQKEHVCRKVEKFTVFQHYMEKTVEAGEEFHELRDIIARYETLTTTHQVKCLCYACTVYIQGYQHWLLSQVSQVNH